MVTSGHQELSDAFEELALIELALGDVRASSDVEPSLAVLRG
jgi:hypothetical protein